MITLLYNHCWVQRWNNF